MKIFRKVFETMPSIIALFVIVLLELILQPLIKDPVITGIAYKVFGISYMICMVISSQVMARVIIKKNDNTIDAQQKLNENMHEFSQRQWEMYGIIDSLEDTLNNVEAVHEKRLELARIKEDVAKLSPMGDKQ